MIPSTPCYWAVVVPKHYGTSGSPWRQLHRKHKNGQNNGRLNGNGAVGEFLEHKRIAFDVGVVNT